MDRREYLRTHRRLLQLERQAEIDAANELLQTRSDAELLARGISLQRLMVADLEPGFGGRLLAVLQPSRGGPLPAHRFGPGDVVALRSTREGPPLGSAVVLRCRHDSITLALDDEDFDLPPLLRIDRLVTEVTYRRLDEALRGLDRELRGDAARLPEVLFGEREPACRNQPLAEQLAPLDPNLDPSQREAIAHALRAEQVALIHGPPGTGKTTALVEFIRQSIQRGERVLACAPSNVATDNLAERLAATGTAVVRLGHPARIAQGVRDVSLSSLIDAAPEQKLLRDLRRELQTGLRQLHKAQRRDDRAAARNLLRQLRAEQRQLEQAITRGFLDAADVVLCTLTGAADALLDGCEFDVVVIDEAAQALEAACWIALPRARRAVLAGDHNQLPPTIRSLEAQQQGLGLTLFERLARSPSGPAITSMLRQQYRMHNAIMAWPNRRFYAGQLLAAPLVQAHRLCDLPGVQTTEWTEQPLCFIDTAGAGCEESAGDDDGSKQNPGEADLVQKLVLGLLESGVGAGEIAVLSPYNAQVQLLRERFGELGELEIGTVDGLQGREKEAVLVSLVRSNERGEVGFLSELRRLNVALTRARRHLCVIGDSATLAHHRDLLDLVEHLQQHAHYRSAFELL
jgi:superfamily I DNA and/or RNA helicase